MKGKFIGAGRYKGHVLLDGYWEALEAVADAARELKNTIMCMSAVSHSIYTDAVKLEAALKELDNE